MYLILRRDFKMAVPHRETTPKLLGGDVCSVFHSDILLNGADKTPELLLHKLSGNHLKHTRTRSCAAFKEIQKPQIV